MKKKKDESKVVRFGPCGFDDDPNNSMMRHAFTYQLFPEEYCQSTNITPYAVVDDFILYPHFERGHDGSYYWNRWDVEGFMVRKVNIPYKDLVEGRFDVLSRVKDILLDDSNDYFSKQIFNCQKNITEGHYVEGNKLEQARMIKMHMRILKEE